MNEEQELAALEAELAALEAAAEEQVKVEEVVSEPEPIVEAALEPIVEAPKPKRKKKESPTAADVKVQAPDPKAAAIAQYGAARLRAQQAAKGLR